jgi:predicted transcriptional regulator
MDKLSRYKSFKFVVFVDVQHRVSGYMPSWAARRVLGNPTDGDKLLGIINDTGRHHELSRQAYVETKPLRLNDSRAVALRKMIDQNLDALVVVDDKMQLAGVAERERLIVRILLSIVEKT